ncbi:hypothetical protein GGR56DRAFT_595435 [Xylariaceae sp. FL0804]|nr:hypothetical protein GGR56DRAFT_595435 [Xylariaceae sp. FL0804]
MRKTRNLVPSGASVRIRPVSTQLFALRYFYLSTRNQDRASWDRGPAAGMGPAAILLFFISFSSRAERRTHRRPKVHQEADRPHLRQPIQPGNESCRQFTASRTVSSRGNTSEGIPGTGTAGSGLHRKALRHFHLRGQDSILGIVSHRQPTRRRCHIRQNA